MTIISLMLFVTICVLSSALSLKNSMTANLDELAPADIQFTMSVKDDDWLDQGYNEQQIENSKLGVRKNLEALNLYLDNYPTDREAVKQYKKFQEEASKAIKEYERMYGPLTVTGVTAQDWTWVNEPWPWDNN